MGNQAPQEIGPQRRQDVARGRAKILKAHLFGRTARGQGDVTRPDFLG